MPTATNIDTEETLAEAMAHRQAGRAGMAAQIYQDLLKQDPDNVAALSAWASLAVSAGNTGRATGLLEHALHLQPCDAQTAISLCDLYIRQDMPWKVPPVCESILATLTDDEQKTAVYTRYGNALRMLKRSAEALDYYTRAHDLNPDTANIINLASACIDLNKKEEGETLFRQAMDTAPKDTKVHFLYALSHDYPQGDPHIEQMQALLAGYPKPDFDRARLCMALGNAFHKQGRYEEAFRHYLEGNAILRSFFRYSIEQDEARLAAIRDIFSGSDLFKNYKPLSLEARPVFIVGMPRSGTSLIEQMLAAHPDIETAGETLQFQNTLARLGIDFPNRPAGLAALDDDKLNAIAENYLASLRHYADAPNIIEKLPWNFLYIGLIKTLYPEARIIHIRRDARDTCVSIYRCWFSTPHPYMYDLAELGRYYRLYEELMQFWRGLYPGFIYDMDYEDLVRDPEKEIRAVLEYCGLPWSPACLKFHESDRPVLTASVRQVRQPIYSSALQSWKRYEPYVSALAEALNAKS